MTLRLLAVLLLASVASAGRFVEPDKDARVVDGQFLVTLEQNVANPETKSSSIVRKHRVRKVAEVSGPDGLIQGFAFSVSSGLRADARTIARRIANESGVAAVEAMQLFSVDPPPEDTGGQVPCSPEQTSKRRKGSSRKLRTYFGEALPYGIYRIQAYMQSPPPPFAIAAVLDTGVDTDHPDLTIHPASFSVVPGESVLDTDGHGTHCAGTIGARDQGSGIVGVAPGAPILGIKVLSSVTGSGSTWGIIDALQWVRNNTRGLGLNLNVGVVSMSLGGSFSPALNFAVNSLVEWGVPVVVAAGNAGASFVRMSPASAFKAITVTAVNDTNAYPSGNAANGMDFPASFSNWAPVGSGHENHTIAAPGFQIYSTAYDDEYRCLSGTSMATPHVAGLVLRCLRGKCAGLPAAQVAGRLIDSARADVAASRGFFRDPRNSPDGLRYFGYMPHALPLDPKT